MPGIEAQKRRLVIQQAELFGALNRFGSLSDGARQYFFGAVSEPIIFVENALVSNRIDSVSAGPRHIRNPSLHY
jgi:hypothetical protein